MKWCPEFWIAEHLGNRQSLLVVEPFICLMQERLLGCYGELIQMTEAKYEVGFTRSDRSHDAPKPFCGPLLFFNTPLSSKESRRIYNCCTCKELKSRETKGYEEDISPQMRCCQIKTKQLCEHNSEDDGHLGKDD